MRGGGGQRARYLILFDGRRGIAYFLNVVILHLSALCLFFEWYLLVCTEIYQTRRLASSQRSDAFILQNCIRGQTHACISPANSQTSPQKHFHIYHQPQTLPNQFANLDCQLVS